MDDVDKKILSIIQKDATIPLSELSKKSAFQKLPVGIESEKWKKKELLNQKLLF